MYRLTQKIDFYSEKLFFHASGMKDFIGGVILYDETINQISSLKQTIPELISKSGAVPGIKVDTGAKILSRVSMKKKLQKV